MDNLRERLAAIWAWIKETWGKASKRARIIFLASVAIVLILGLVLTLQLNKKEYVLLYRDLDSVENSKVIAVLNDAAIPYQVSNGRLLVEAKDEDRARLQLAVQGFENTGFITYDLANSGGLTATQQDKDRNTLYQLQNRLQSTIELFPEVKTAVVTISSPQRSMFALQDDNTPTSASITIQKNAGRELTVEQIRGIINIVKDSVQGLDESNISIVDENGDLKSIINSSNAFNSKKLNLTEQVNKSLRDQIMSMVQPLYGAGNVNVVVMTTLDTDSSVSEHNTYVPIDPENPTNNPLDYAEFDRQKTGDGFAQVQGVPGTQDNVQTPQYAAQEAEAENADYYNSHDIYDYLVSTVREQIVKDGFKIEKSSASILVNTATRPGETLPGEERSALIALAANASGIAAENITVQGLRYASSDTPGTEIIDPKPVTNIFIIVGIILLALCILLIIILTSISRRRKAQQEAEEAEAEAMAIAEEEAQRASLLELMNEEVEYEPIALVESAEQKLKLQIKDLAESDPEIVAQLIKTWLVSTK